MYLIAKFWAWVKSFFVKPEPYNPLALKEGQHCSFNRISHLDYPYYTVSKIDRITHDTGPVMVNYYMVGKGVCEKVDFRLTVTKDDQTHRILLMKLYFEEKYNQDTYDCFTSGDVKFNIEDTIDGQLVSMDFWRIADNLQSHKCDTIEYWDYHRLAGEEKIEEFLFCEMDRDNGWIQMWRGREIQPENIAP